MDQGKSAVKNSKTKKPRPPRKITESYLHNAGLYYLQRFAASSAHFKTVMMRKIDRSCSHHKEQNREECIRLLDRLVSQFQETGLLDDQSYTRAMVQTFRRRGLSARMIYARLQAKGLSREMIEEHLQKYAEDYEEDDELIAALRLARRKKIGPYMPDCEEDIRKEKQTKALGIMGRAGFSYDICRKVLEMDKEETEALNADGIY